jgi:hypothetical protein
LTKLEPWSISQLVTTVTPTVDGPGVKLICLKNTNHICVVACLYTGEVGLQLGQGLALRVSTTLPSAKLQAASFKQQATSA